MSKSAAAAKMEAKASRLYNPPVVKSPTGHGYVSAPKPFNKDERANEIACKNAMKAARPPKF